MMKQQCRPISISTRGFLILLLILHLRPISSSQENEKEFNYLEGSSKGPKHWGDLHHEWATCKKGLMQSPIDLLHHRVEVAPELGILRTGYKTANTTIKNRGHDIMLKFEGDAGSIHINGTDYKLQQCHWHSPSEHTINGRRFDLELHMVHQSSNLSVAVIGVLYRVGEPDRFLSELEKQIQAVADTKNEITAGKINPTHIHLSGRKYYRYLGSFTAPPCTEGVIWTVIKKVKTVSAEQLKLLRSAVHDYGESNARPSQALNDRVILHHSPEH